MARFKIKYILIKWIINTVSLFIVVETIKGLDIIYGGLKGIFVLFLAAGMIGIINVFLKPMVLLLTLPLSIMTFGIFTLFINGILFAFAAFIVPGFRVTSIWGAIVGSLLFSIVSLICNMFIKSEANYYDNDNNDGDDEIKVEYKVLE